jgi:hypothetical protein
MSADPIVYCLEKLTDYTQFERLCSDVMAGSGFPDIEPLGGTNDGGRDAWQSAKASTDELTIFAYTVRVDWRRKLLEDCGRIRELGHNPNRLVFACTSSLSASQKDEIRHVIKSTFGWEFEVFDLERLRLQLAGALRHLLARHISIFAPPWFPTRGGLSISEARDTLVIDHVDADHAFATWLANRLQICGYQCWNYGSAPLAGENADESVRQLVEKRALHYLPILSSEATSDPDMMARVMVALNTEGLTLPCWAKEPGSERLPQKLLSITPIRFDKRWSIGLHQLLEALRVRAVPLHLGTDRGMAMALRSYVPEPLTRPEPERVFASVFQTTVPTAIVVCELEESLDEVALAKIRREWAFAVASEKFLLAFEPPTVPVPLVAKRRLPEFAWKVYSERFGRRTDDVIRELIRRSLDVACFRAGMTWCENREVFYFAGSESIQKNVAYRHVDGRNTRVAVTGEVTAGSGEYAKAVRYQLGPRFRVGQDEDGQWWVTMRVYVRVTTRDGVLFEKKQIGKKRKAVTKSWWNRQWLARTLGLMQAISMSNKDIQVGDGKRMLSVSTSPLEWQCPISIDGDAVERVGDFQEEMAAAAYRFAEDLEAETEVDAAQPFGGTEPTEDE